MSDVGTRAAIEELERDLDIAKSDYLRRFGWVETSNTPGSIWLWWRDFSDVDERRAKWHREHPTASPHRPYGRITAPTDVAVRMTASEIDFDEGVSEE